jgi:hypothetical protein
MRYKIIAILTIGASVFSSLALAGSNSLNAQVATNFTTGTNATNSTMGNMTAGSTHTTIAKTQIEEGIKALQAGDNNSARDHLSAAQHALELVFEDTVTLPTAGASSKAIKDFDDGMDALQAGDINGAIPHFTAAVQALG